MPMDVIYEGKITYLHTLVLLWCTACYNPQAAVDNISNIFHFGIIDCPAHMLDSCFPWVPLGHATFCCV